MIDVLKSLKKDLLGRRLAPFVALVGVALLAAVAYAVVGGGSSSPKTSASLAPALPPAPTTVATAAPANPKVAVAETTSGTSYQTGGPIHDPFVPLPQKKTKAAVATAPSSSTASPSSSAGSSGASAGSPGAGSSSPSSGSSPSSSGGGGSSGGSSPSGPSSPSPSPSPAKPKKAPVYQVALLFGLAPPVGQNPQLTPYEDLSKLTPLPSKQNQLLIYAGVGPTGKGALFTLLEPAILKGAGVCLPSTTQCEEIDLTAGKAEELSYIGETGQPYAYILQVVSITKQEATAHTARAHTAKAHSAKAHVAKAHAARWRAAHKRMAY
jgi:hypothetical protein